MWRHPHFSRASRNKRAEVKVETRSIIIVWPLLHFPHLASLASGIEASPAAAVAKLGGGN